MLALSRREAALKRSHRLMSGVIQLCWIHYLQLMIITTSLQAGVAELQHELILGLAKFIIIMNPGELSKKLEESIRTAKCSNKGCLSGGKDNLDIVWFGNQYEQKIITCSSCYIMNDEAIKKSLPTAQNIMPLSAFINKFVSEAKTYEEYKSSPKWLPTDLKQRQKQHLSQLDSFEFKLTGTLKALTAALEGFAKKVTTQSQAIYNNQTFNEIISMYSNSQMDQSLAKIQSLINYLNYGADEKYRFDDMEFRAKRNEKLTAKIQQITTRVIKTLEQLFVQIQQKNAIISKI